MVWTDPVSQDPDALRRLSDHYAVPILAVHAPCLLITQRVWGTEPWVKLERARAAAEKLRAPTVVVHPPFRWQRDYARGFRQRHRAAGRARPTSGSRWRTCSRCGSAAARSRRTRRTGTRPIEPYRAYTLDLSHTAVARATRWRWPRRWATGSRTCTSPTAPACAKDEHLVPGRGTQPCGELLERLAGTRLRRLGRGRGEHPPGRRPGRAGGRPGRGAGLHPAAPGRDR